MLDVVIRCGGVGCATVIPALIDRQGLHATAVGIADDAGESTGKIRPFSGMQGPTDIRKVQVKFTDMRRKLHALA
jgi:2-phospho-L-lactate transferase/gluconeogenesis factor (CofD/UPF0052 family)